MVEGAGIGGGVSAGSRYPNGTGVGGGYGGACIFRGCGRPGSPIRRAEREWPGVWRFPNRQNIARKGSQA